MQKVILGRHDDDFGTQKLHLYQKLSWKRLEMLFLVEFDQKLVWLEFDQKLDSIQMAFDKSWFDGIPPEASLGDIVPKVCLGSNNHFGRV